MIYSSNPKNRVLPRENSSETDENVMTQEKNHDQNGVLALKRIYSLGYSFGLYILPWYQPRKVTKKMGIDCFYRKQFASDSLPRGGQPPFSLKNEPPYSFFAADLLVAQS